jgi:hypothetical protein
MRPTLLAVFALTLAAAAIGCNAETTDDDGVREDVGGKADSTFVSLAGSYYAFDGANWFVLMLSKPDTKGHGTYLWFAGVTARGAYAIVDNQLILNPGKPDQLVSTFTVSDKVLSVSNPLGTGMLFLGPAFCEIQDDCFAQATPPQDATWTCVNFMCQPSTPQAATCADAGGICLSDPNDVGFPAVCSALGSVQLNGECAAINQACCAPVEPE